MHRSIVSSRRGRDCPTLAEASLAPCDNMAIHKVGITLYEVTL